MASRPRKRSTGSASELRSKSDSMSYGILAFEVGCFCVTCAIQDIGCCLSRARRYQGRLARCIAASQILYAKQEGVSWRGNGRYGNNRVSIWAKWQFKYPAVFYPNARPRSHCRYHLNWVYQRPRRLNDHRTRCRVLRLRGCLVRLDRLPVGSPGRASSRHFDSGLSD